MAIHIDIPPNIEERFRKDAYSTFGYGKGSIRKALLEAISMWMDAKTEYVRREI